MAQNLATDLETAATDAVSTLANAAREGLGAGADVANAVIGEVEGVGALTVDKAETLIQELLAHLKNAAGGA